MGYRVAVAGATGAVGVEMVSTLEKRNFPVSSLRLLASSRSIGKEMKYKGETIKVEELKSGCFQGLDLALFSIKGEEPTRNAAQWAKEAGCLVVDNSRFYRMDPNVPLVVPEVNPEDCKLHKGLIANPNCSTIIMNVTVWPLHKKYRVKRMVISTYQAASGGGQKVMDELVDETRAWLEGKPYERKHVPHPYAFNLFPHNDTMTENGYNKEELKMVYETRKIFHEPEFKVTATCVRVPVLRAHSESLNMEFEGDPSVEDAYRILSTAPGVRIVEDRAKNRWPMPSDASGQGDILVGRIRRDLSQPRTLEMWVVGDQLLKGAALNAVQIAEVTLNTIK
jgi:aspartate-semialdehyde dehydrogenase